MSLFNLASSLYNDLLALILYIGVFSIISYISRLFKTNLLNSLVNFMASEDLFLPSETIVYKSFFAPAKSTSSPTYIGLYVTKSPVKPVS